MSSTQPSRKKSTNVRPIPWQVRPLRQVFQVLNRLAPTLAVRWAVRLFRTARSYSPPPRELCWLESATAARLSFTNPYSGEEGHLAVSIWGEEGRPTVLLVHGWEGRGSQMGAFAAPLVEAGYRVVSLDAPGHGETGGRLCSLPEFAAAVARAGEAFGPFHGVVAHSFGSAATGRALSHLGLAAERLVWIAPPSDLEFYVDYLAGLLGLTPWVREGMVRHIEESFRVHWEDARFATLKAARKLPLLLIHDEDDEETTVADSELLARAWPDSRLLVTTGLGHRRILRDPDVVEEVVGFLAADEEAAVAL